MKKVKANFKNPKHFAWYNGDRVYNHTPPFYLKSADEKLGSWMVEVTEDKPAPPAPETLKGKK